MTALFAVYPPRGTIVHLYLGRYRPGPKSRSVTETTMCGANANESVPPPVGPIPTGRVHVPIADAIRSDAFVAGAMDPRPAWKWCSKCLGHATTHYNLTALVLAAIIEKAGDV